MTLRIYTEDKNSEQVVDLCNKYFSMYSMYRGMGVWKGTREPSLIIEVVDENEVKAGGLMQKLAKDIKRVNEQEAVLITRTQSTNELI